MRSILIFFQFLVCLRLPFDPILLLLFCIAYAQFSE